MRVVHLVCFRSLVTPVLRWQIEMTANDWTNSVPARQPMLRAPYTPPDQIVLLL